MADPDLPPLLAHYMPWFQLDAAQHGKAGWHWTMNTISTAQIFETGKIAAHERPLIGPYGSACRLVIRYHLELMRLSGICGVIINWYGTRDKNDYPMLLSAANIIVEEVIAADMLFTVCYEDWTTADGLRWGMRPDGALLQQAQQQLKRDFEYVRDHYMGRPGFLREGKRGKDGRPVLLVFGPRCLTAHEDWASMAAEVFINEAPEPIVYTLQGQWGGANRFAWFPPLSQEGTSLQQVHQYLSNFYEHEAAAGRNAIGVAWPGFHDYYNEGTNGKQKSYGCLPDHGGHTLEAAVARAKIHQPLFLQLATWNDWGEGTQFEPSKEKGHYYLAKIRRHALGADDAALVEACERWRATLAQV